MASVRILSAPTGEAPLAIREAWIGCILPLPDTAYGRRRNWRVVGVLSGANKGWLARLFSRSRLDGYPVGVAEALSVLDSMNPAAADWWRQNATHMLAPNRVFVFDAAACEELPDE